VFCFTGKSYTNRKSGQIISQGEWLTYLIQSLYIMIKGNVRGKNWNLMFRATAYLSYLFFENYKHSASKKSIKRFFSISVTSKSNQIILWSVFIRYPFLNLVIKSTISMATSTNLIPCSCDKQTWMIIRSETYIKSIFLTWHVFWGNRSQFSSGTSTSDWTVLLWHSRSPGSNPHPVAAQNWRGSFSHPIRNKWFSL